MESGEMWAQQRMKVVVFYEVFIEFV